MIVQCDQCNTKFKLDDAKVKESGVKVRCSKCKNVFIVRKEIPPDETDFDSLLSGLGGSAPTNVEPKPAESLEESFGVPGQPVGEALESPQKEIPKQDEKWETFETGLPAAGDEEAFAFTDEPLAEQPVSMPSGDEQEKVPEPAGNNEYDFGDATFDEAVEAVDSRYAPATHPADEFEFESFTAGQPEEPAMASTKEDIFSIDDAAPPEPEIKTELPEEPGEPLDFGDIDFGESIAAAPPTAKQDSKELTAATEKQSVQSTAPSSTFHDTATSSPSTVSVSPEDALPPLSISSRREGNSIVPIAVIAIAILFVIALAGGGFYFLNEGPAAFNKLGLGFLAEWAGMEAVEEGGIIVSKPVGRFLVNKEAGEIFIVSGEAVNNFKKPRASIQVKATIYGPKGETIQQKVAYCGNPLSSEQLGILPMGKIESAMLNQFGDSLTNLGVQPGKAIPFVVVFTKVPKEAGEFGVEVVGSTVASQ